MIGVDDGTILGLAYAGKVQEQIANGIALRLMFAVENSIQKAA